MNELAAQPPADTMQANIYWLMQNEAVACSR